MSMSWLCLSLHQIDTQQEILFRVAQRSYRAAVMSPADEIAKLHELLTKGVLTQAEFEQGKAQILGSNPQVGASPGAVGSRLRRSSADYWLGGVCGGLGKASGIETWIWRLVFACSILLGGIGIIPYVLLWIFVPLDTSGN